MEQVIRAFLPWETIAKKYFVEAPADVPIIKNEPDTKTVQFEEDSESESEDEEEEAPKLTISDEVETIQIEDLDEKKETEQAVVIPEQPEDPLKEIESKMSNETLVLKL